MRDVRWARVVVRLVAMAMIVGLLLPAAGAQAQAVFGAAPVATGLAFPNALTVAPDGTIFYGERLTGKIAWVDPITAESHTFATIPMAGSFMGHGLMSVALAPGYPQNPYLYVSLARTVNGVPKLQLLRLTDGGGVSTSSRLIWQGNAGTDHNASRIAFGPDGKLYLAVGDAGNPATAQDLSVANGKMLRMGLLGGVPKTNPFAGSRVWAYGLRNTIGVAFDPLTGRLWETDNGPECNDEINRITRAGNYGWGPSETCTPPPAAPADTNQDGPAPLLPQAWYATTIGPTGAAFCDTTCALGSGTPGALFFGDVNLGQIHMLTLGAKRWGVAGEAVVYTDPSGVLAVEADHHGGIVFSDPSGIYRLTAQ